MEPDLFENHIRRLYNQLKSLSTRSVKSAGPGDIHDMRVQIKRLSLVCAFLDESGITAVRQMDEYRVLKEYFKSAGRLRDIQNQLQILEAYSRMNDKGYAEYVLYLDGMESRARSRITSGNGKFPLQELKMVISYVQKAVRNSRGQDIHKLSVRFVKDRSRKVEEHYLDHDSGPSLHQLRKTIKELRYFLELFVECSTGQDLPSVRFEEIRQVEDLLGKWNDLNVFCMELKRYSTNYKLVHGIDAFPAYENLLLQVSGNAADEIGDIQPILLGLITNLSMSLMRLN